MPYVFIHGLGQSAAGWKETVSRLPDGVREASVCPELFAPSLEAETGYPALYSAFAAYCGRLERPLDLCGLSLGGVLALHYAVEHPEAVRSMALLGAQFKMPRALLKLQNVLFGLMPESAFRETGLGKGVMIRLTDSMADLDFSGMLDRVRCPVLVMCGEKDRANLRASRQLERLLPAARLCVIPGAGHALNADAPGALAARLSEFYEDIRRG